MEELPPQVHVLSFGEGDRNVFRASRLRVNRVGVHSEGPFGTMMVTSPLIGRYSVMSVFASFAILHALGHSVKRCGRKVGAFEGVDGRMESVERGQNYKVVVDYAYAADALRNALGMLKDVRKEFAFGLRMWWRQGQRQTPRDDRVACAGADRIWATADNPRTEPKAIYFQGHAEGWPKERRFLLSRPAKGNQLGLGCRKGKTRFDSWKRYEAFQEVQYTAIPFDDRKVAGEVLSAKILAL